MPLHFERRWFWKNRLRVNVIEDHFCSNDSSPKVNFSFSKCDIHDYRIGIGLHLMKSNITFALGNK